MVVEEKENEWLLKGKETNGCKGNEKEMVVNGNENKWLLKQTKKNSF